MRFCPLNGSRLTLYDEVKSLQVSLDTLDPDLYALIKGVPPSLHWQVIEGIRRCIVTVCLHSVMSSVAEKGVLTGLPDLMR